MHPIQLPRSTGAQDRGVQDGRFGSYADFYAASRYSAFGHEVRRGGSFGMQVLRVEQGPHDLTDVATPDLLIGIRRRIAPRPARYHLGDRWISIDTRRPLTVCAPPDTDVHYDIGGDNDLIILAVPIHRLPDAPETRGLAGRLGAIYERPFRDPLLTDVAERLWREIAVKDDASSLFVDSGLIAVLGLLLRRAEGCVDPTGDAIPARDGRIDRVVDYIESYLHSDISLEDLAQVACLSSFHFLRTFKAAMGTTPLRYVSDRRIARAQALLRETRSTMSEVAHLCGFSDQARFATTFRRHCGVTPSAWRRELR